MALRAYREEGCTRWDVSWGLRLPSTMVTSQQALAGSRQERSIPLGSLMKQSW